MMNRKKREEMAERLAELELENGGTLTPEIVIRDAKNPESVLHSLFEWDDTIAAHQHRIYQARHIIGSIRYTYSVENHSYSAPQYVRDPEKDSSEQGYVSIARLRTDEELAREAMVNEFARAASHLRRAHEIARALRFKPEDIEQLVSRVTALSEALLQPTSN